MRQLLASQLAQLQKEEEEDEAPSCLTGRVSLLQAAAGGHWQGVPIVLKVYRSSTGAVYLVLSQERILCKEAGCVRLRNCTIRTLPASTTPAQPSEPALVTASSSRGPSRGRLVGKTSSGSSRRSAPAAHGFQIVPWDRDGAAMTFAVATQEEETRWVEGLTKLTSATSSTSTSPLSQSPSPSPSWSAPSRRTRMSSLPALEEDFKE